MPISVCVVSRGGCVCLAWNRNEKGDSHTHYVVNFLHCAFFARLFPE